jgi:D-beta-D-heptose 7-phosphate kinase / D-beta-D-heptose 1-phosphate adenosyltransferase
LFSVVGADTAGQWLYDQWDYNHNRSIIDKTRSTTQKIRILCNEKQIARLDIEQKHPLSKKQSKKFLELLCDSVHKFDGVILQDYGKGLWNKTTLKFIPYCKKLGIKVFVDPYKNRKISDYSGAYLIKPNLKEAQRMSPVDYGISLPTLASKLSEIANCPYIVITAGANYITSTSVDSKFNMSTVQIPAMKITKIVDVTGAGDTFLSVLVLSMLKHTSLRDALLFASKAAGLSIQQLGPGRVTWRQLCETKS